MDSNMHWGNLVRRFKPGQRVQVLDHATRRPWYVGTVVKYWRNDCFTIREDAYGTTCCHHSDDLELIWEPPCKHDPSAVQGVGVVICECGTILFDDRQYRPISDAATAVIAGLVAPSDAVNHAGITADDAVWDEIRSVFPMRLFADRPPTVGYDPGAGL